MIRIIISTIVFLISSCALSQKLSKVSAVRITNFDILHLAIDNNCIDSIGYEKNNDGPDIGIISMILNKNDVYLADKYHGNIKRLNLVSGKMISSDILNSHHQPWINDICVFDQHLVVLSDLDTCYILNLDLNHVEYFTLERGDKFFTKIGDSLYVYNLSTQKCLKLSDIYKIRRREIDCDIPDIWNKSNLIKDYSYLKVNGSRFIIFLNQKLQIKTEFPLDLIRYDARNLDFDKKNLAYFGYKDNQFLIYVYNFK